MINSQWHIKKINQKQVEAIEKEFNLPHPIARVMALRGITNREATSPFFKPSKDDMHSPFKLKGMETAVNRIIQQQKNEKKILIFGDYDVDGVSSTSLLYLFLNMLFLMF